MAVPEQTPYKEYTANGSTTSFALGFICDSKNDLIVLVDNVAPPVATWSLVGGNAVFTTAPASGKKIILQRQTKFERTTNFQGTNNSFRPETINKDIDRVWLKLQELGVADWLMKLYVDRLHQEQKEYIDQKDDELKNYLIEEIRKQGVALDQLEDYYNRLMQKLAEIALEGGWTDSIVATWSGRTQEEKNKERISILDFGGKAQSGFDNSTAMNAAYLYSESVGGCTIVIPASGNNNYEFMDYVYAKSNTTVIVDDGVWIDASSQSTGEATDLIEGVWNISGSFVGSEIPLSANATSGDTAIKANNHGLQPGDYALLKSQRNAFSIADSGQDWWLGRATGSLNAHACYFGEPIEVLSVVSENEFTIRNPIIFPDYRTDKTLEANIKARNSATIQKMDFIKNSFVIGGSYKLDGSTMFREFVSLNCGVQKTKCDMGANIGSAIQAIYSLYHVNTDNEAVHSAEDYLTVDHSHYNSFKDKSSWYGTWSYTDKYGMQGLDMTYILNGVCGIHPHILYARTYNSNENSITSHCGIYGYTIDSVLAINNKQSPVFLRSRGGYVGPCVMISRLVSAEFVSLNTCAIDIVFTGGYIEGSQLNTNSLAFNIGGVSTYEGTAFIDNQQFHKPVDISNFKIRNVARLANIRNGIENPANDIDSGVSFSKIRAYNYLSGFRVWSGFVAQT